MKYISFIHDPLGLICKIIGHDNLTRRGDGKTICKRCRKVLFAGIHSNGTAKEQLKSFCLRELNSLSRGG